MSFENDVRAWHATPLFTGGLTLVLLVALQRFFRKSHASFAVDPDDCAPGRTVKGTLLTEKRPEKVTAVLELYRANDDRPVRSLPVAVGAPASADDGWRTSVSAVLPDDARPDFDGGWAFSIKADVDGSTALEGDNVELLNFYLIPPGPYAPGASLRAVLYTAQKPEKLTAVLELDRDRPFDPKNPPTAAEAEADAPERSVRGEAGEPVRTANGWRTEVTAVLPADAEFDFEGGWGLCLGGKAGDEAIDGYEPFELLKRS